MNVDAILTTLNDHQVEYVLIGGTNFLLRHKPVLTFDVDVWLHDTPVNRKRCEEALDEPERKPDRVDYLRRLLQWDKCP